MSTEPHPQDPALGEAVQEDPAETLDGEIGTDPLDAGYVPPDRPYAVEGFGTTALEESIGASLDERLRAEEPDPTAFDATDRPVPRPDIVDAERAGRLVAPDEGVRHDDVGEMTASDEGVAGGAASAEEAAMHVADESDVEASSVDGPTPEKDRL